MTVNEVLLRGVMATIKAREEADTDNAGRWYQGTWASVSESFTSGLEADETFTVSMESLGEPACGTAFCFAGWTALAAGATMEFSRFNPSVSQCITPEGRREMIADYAEKQLGISASDRAWLFAGSRTFDELEAGVERILAGERPDGWVPEQVTIELRRKLEDNYTVTVTVPVGEDPTEYVDSLTERQIMDLWEDDNPSDYHWFSASVADYTAERL